MKQQTLFAIPDRIEVVEETDLPILEQLGFRLVTMEDREHAEELLYKNLEGDVLYNHCFEYLHSYFQGVKSAWIGTYNRHEFVVAKKYKNKPQFFIHCPNILTLEQYIDLKGLVRTLQPHTLKPVSIIDLNTTQMQKIVAYEEDAWEVKKEGKDVILELEKCIKLPGRKFRGIKSNIKQFIRNNPTARIVPLTTEQASIDALQATHDWKEKQGKKYFRVTLGRDIEMFSRFWKYVDNKKVFGFVIYVNDYPVAATMSSVSVHDGEYGFRITTRSDVDYKGLTDFAFQHIFQLMYDAGIRYSNESTIYGAGTKQNKMKWQPVAFYEMYKLSLKN